MIVYRCSLDKHISGMLSGAGALKYGGRWNSIGTAAIYTAESRMMAILEILIRQPIDKIANDFRIIPVEFDGNYISPDLPKNWKKDIVITQEIGDKILNDPSILAFKVPSVLLAESYNFVINPLHPDINNLVKVLTPEKILMDDRLLKALRK